MRFLVILSLITTIASCQNTATTKTSNVQESPTTIAVASKPDNAAPATWLDDFRNFRDAVYQPNLSKLKTYFNFPLADEGSGIWYLCQLTPAEANKRKAGLEYPDLFYEKDFDKYYTRLFSKEFIKSLLKIKSEALYQKGAVETIEFNDGERPYKMYANVDEEDQTLTLNVAYFNGKDAEGNYVSEGEYNIIYIFKIINNQHLQFDRITMAG